MAAYSCANMYSDCYPLASKSRASAAYPSVDIQPLADGTAGTFQTLAAMRGAVLGLIPPDFSGYQDPYNQQAANKIIGSSFGPVVNPLFAYVRDVIFYVN